MMFSRSFALQINCFASHLLSSYPIWWLRTVLDALIKFIGLFFSVVGMLEQAGTGQTATHAYSHQYAPTTHNYGGYAINQEYVVNTAVPVQEVRFSPVRV